MAKSTKRKNTTLHCQFCGQKRKMAQFLAIDTSEPENKEKRKTYPFSVKKFLDLIQSDQVVKLPKYYAGVCSACLQPTYYQGQNQGTKLKVVVT
jgi:hypothetical protein